MKCAVAGIRRGYLELAHGQVHYRRAGTPGKPLVVLLHQTPSTSEMYEPLMTLLAPTFDCFAPDTPGFGQSDALRGGFSIEAAASALGSAVRRICDGAVNWFGHHTGAALALQVAATRPEQVDRLAMSGPCLLDEAMRKALPQRAAHVPVADDGSHLRTVWDRIAAKDAAAPLQIRQRETLAGLDAGEHYARAYASVCETDTAAQLRSLKCPALVFAGTDDPLYPRLEAAHRLLARGQKAQIPGARTFVCERNAPEVAALLQKFFGAANG